jgi:hypothetical protein
MNLEKNELVPSTPTSIIGDVKQSNELKKEIEEEFLAFSAEMYRRGKLLIKLHEVIFVENLKKQEIFDLLKEKSQLMSRLEDLGV